jgi:peroxiredoxin
LEALNEQYKERNVLALVIDVLEDKKKTTEWAEALKWSIPVLLDRDGKVSESYAPKDVLPDLPRNQVPIASNLIIDKEGKIQFYSLLDSKNFDAKLIALKAKLEKLLSAE